MNPARLFRVIASFVVVFVLGGATGWLLKPSIPATARRGPSGERVLENLDARLNFTAEQKARIAPILEEWERETAQGPRGPRRRRQLLDRYAPRIRETLMPGQLPEYDKRVQESREWLERRMR
jgi:hypothetical protein